MAAMKCRGFKGKFYIIDDYQMKGLDYIVAGSGSDFHSSFTNNQMIQLNNINFKYNSRPILNSSGFHR